MNNNGKTVIIADDHETSVMYLSILMRRMGYSVIPARNGREVLQILETVTPDLLITDGKMPEMDGLATLRAMKGDPRLAGIPAILVSTFLEKEGSEEWMTLGGAGFLPKPIKIADLHHLLVECVTYPNNNVRKKLRFFFGGKVQVGFEGRSEEYYAVTLSEGGVFLRTHKPIPVGGRVHIRFETQPGKLFDAQGTVIYHTNIFKDIFKVDPGMAVRFEDLSHSEAEGLRAYILDMLAGDLLEEQQESVFSNRDIQVVPLRERLSSARQAWQESRNAQWLKG